MGAALRIFLVGDDDSLDRIPAARYGRLIQRDPRVRLPRYAGKRVRCAAVYLELMAREPLAILGVQYFLVHFDGEGRLDPDRLEKEARFTDPPASPFGQEPRSTLFLPPTERVLEGQYGLEREWVPTPALKRAIIEEAFPAYAKRKEYEDRLPARKP